MPPLIISQDGGLTFFFEPDFCFCFLARQHPFENVFYLDFFLFSIEIFIIVVDFEGRL